MSDAKHNDPGMVHPDTGDAGIGTIGNEATGIFPVHGPDRSPGARAPMRSNEGSAIVGGPAGDRPSIDPLFAWASDSSRPSDTGNAGEANALINPGDPNPQRMGPERWVIAGGTVVALVAAFIAFTAGGTPIHAMPSPFAQQPAQSAPAQSGSGQGTPPYATAVTPTTCTPATPTP